MQALGSHCDRWTWASTSWQTSTYRNCCYYPITGTPPFVLLLPARIHFTFERRSNFASLSFARRGCSSASVHSQALSGHVNTGRSQRHWSACSGIRRAIRITLITDGVPAFPARSRATAEFAELATSRFAFYSRWNDGSNDKLIAVTDSAVASNRSSARENEFQLAKILLCSRMLNRFIFLRRAFKLSSHSAALFTSLLAAAAFFSLPRPKCALNCYTDTYTITCEREYDLNTK